jgi:hypothetical protein
LADSYNDFVSVDGIVHLFTDLGIFLDVQGRRVFVPGHCMEPAFRRFRQGDVVTLRVLRSYAEREHLAGQN